MDPNKLSNCADVYSPDKFHLYHLGDEAARQDYQKRTGAPDNSFCVGQTTGDYYVAYSLEQPLSPEIKSKEATLTRLMELQKTVYSFENDLAAMQEQYAGTLTQVFADRVVTSLHENPLIRWSLEISTLMFTFGFFTHFSKDIFTLSRTWLHFASGSFAAYQYFYDTMQALMQSRGLCGPPLRADGTPYPNPQPVNGHLLAWISGLGALALTATQLEKYLNGSDELPSGLMDDLALAANDDWLGIADLAVKSDDELKAFEKNMNQKLNDLGRDYSTWAKKTSGLLRRQAVQRLNQLSQEQEIPKDFRQDALKLAETLEANKPINSELKESILQKAQYAIDAVIIAGTIFGGGAEWLGEKYEGSKGDFPTRPPSLKVRFELQTAQAKAQVGVRALAAVEMMKPVASGQCRGGTFEVNGYAKGDNRIHLPGEEEEQVRVPLHPHDPELPVIVVHSPKGWSSPPNPLTRFSLWPEGPIGSRAIALSVGGQGSVSASLTPQGLFLFQAPQTNSGPNPDLMAQLYPDRLPPSSIKPVGQGPKIPRMTPEGMVGGTLVGLSVYTLGSYYLIDHDMEDWVAPLSGALTLAYVFWNGRRLGSLLKAGQYFEIASRASTLLAGAHAGIVVASDNVEAIRASNQKQGITGDQALKSEVRAGAEGTAVGVGTFGLLWRGFGGPLGTILTETVVSRSHAYHEYDMADIPQRVPHPLDGGKEPGIRTLASEKLLATLTVDERERFEALQSVFQVHLWDHPNQPNWPHLYRSLSNPGNADVLSKTWWWFHNDVVAYEESYLYPWLPCGDQTDPVGAEQRSTNLANLGEHMKSFRQTLTQFGQKTAKEEICFTGMEYVEQASEWDLDSASENYAKELSTQMYSVPLTEEALFPDETNPLVCPLNPQENDLFNSPNISQETQIPNS